MIVSNGLVTSHRCSISGASSARSLYSVAAVYMVCVTRYICRISYIGRFARRLLLEDCVYQFDHQHHSCYDILLWVVFIVILGIRMCKDASHARARAQTMRARVIYAAGCR